ncbi:hypothetical protein SAMN05192570_1329 [Brevundimonas viscosa]|uniref:Uncharacterized protein n=1 Tax=Brevundimonas viscosa TaxID=871741 RepID=A0A1I6PVS7_9CAUL|nr:hypothetical protein SAMN05192570_1329 [Brevundimonas viscosa]
MLKRMVRSHALAAAFAPRFAAGADLYSGFRYAG